MRLKGKNANSGDFEITLEPHPVRPLKDFLVKIHWQSKDADATMKFYAEIEKDIGEVFKND